jgi:hypothetical protein
VINFGTVLFVRFYLLRIMPYTPLEVNRRFEGTCLHNHRCDKFKCYIIFYESVIINLYLHKILDKLLGNHHSKSEYCCFLLSNSKFVLHRIFFYFPIYLQSVEIHSDTFIKWCVGKRGRVEECSVAPLRNKRVKTLCSGREKGVQTKENTN